MKTRRRQDTTRNSRTAGRERGNIWAHGIRLGFEGVWSGISVCAIAVLFGGGIRFHVALFC